MQFLSEKKETDAIFVSAVANLRPAPALNI